MTATTTNAAPRAAAAQRSRFYFWLAVAMAVTAFVGFMPTFWIPMAQGTPARIGVIVLHATAFYAWNIFLIAQTWIASTKNIQRHRDFGMIGIALATSMVIFGTIATVNAGKRAVAEGYATGGEAFMIVPMTAMFLFAVFVTAAIANIKRPEWHKRFMICASAAILDAAIARLVITFGIMGGHLPPFQGTVGLAGLPGPPPPVPFALVANTLALLFVVAGALYDWRTRGKVHPAYLWGGGFTLAVELLKVPFSTTPAWHAIARWLLSFAG